MAAVLSSWETLGWRACRYSPSRTHPSPQIASLRVETSLHHRNGGRTRNNSTKYHPMPAQRAASSHAASPSPAILESSATAVEGGRDGQHALPLLERGEMSLVRRILKTTPQQRGSVPPIMPFPERHTILGLSSETGKESGLVNGEEAPQDDPEINTMPKSLKTPATASQYLRSLFFSAAKTRGQGPELSTTAIAKLPPTAFSELLRSLDPVTVVSKELDPTVGIHVGPGMAKRTTIGGDLDIWGVRKIYVLLLHRMVGAARLRLEAGHGLLLSDYKILLRCAGAASDPTSAYFIWRMMDKQGQAHTRDSSTYHEFIKARFLTDELYTQYDLARFRVRPIDLNRQKLRILSHRKLTNLRALERNMLAIRRYRFGQNRHELDKVEHLMRIFRKVRPLKKLFAVVTDGKYPIDEGLLCSFIVAFARSGSLNFIEKNILAPFWGIRLSRFKSGEVTITYTPMPPLGQLIRPTERLLDAVLTSYCSNAEVAAALKLADFISRSYGIPIPERMWFKLLQLAHVQTSKPCCIEWRITGLKYKMVHPKSVEMIWNAMTSPPYNVRPGFAEHRIMITWLLANRRIKEAIALLLELESSYKTLLGELEGAYQRYVLAVELGAGVAKAKKAWLDTHVRKVAMAYEFEVMLYRLLKRVRRNRWLDDDLTARLIPQLVDAFRSLLPATVKYKTPTGTVQIHSFRPVGVTHMARVELDQPAQVTGDIRRPYIRRRSPVPAETASTRALPSALNRGRPDRSRFAALIRRVTFRRAVAWRMDPAALHRKESTVDLLRVFT